MYWVTRGGDVVVSTGDARDGVVECRRAKSGAFLGTRRLDRLRPATPYDVRKAMERGR